MPHAPRSAGPALGRCLSLSVLIHAGALTAASLLVQAGHERSAARGSTEVLALPPEATSGALAQLDLSIEELPPLDPDVPPLDAELVETVEDQPAPELADGIAHVVIPLDPPGWPWRERILPGAEARTAPDAPPDPPAEPALEPPQPEERGLEETPGDQGPEVLVRTRPRYPRAAIRLGQEGAVVLRVHVAADGAVSAVEVESSSGHARLDAAALEAVRSWTFAPARRAGVPVAESLLHTVRFRLTDAS